MTTGTFHISSVGCTTESADREGCKWAMMLPRGTTVVVSATEPFHLDSTTGGRGGGFVSPELPFHRVSTGLGGTLGSLAEVPLHLASAAGGVLCVVGAAGGGGGGGGGGGRAGNFFTGSLPPDCAESGLGEVPAEARITPLGLGVAQARSEAGGHCGQPGPCFGVAGNSAGLADD